MHFLSASASFRAAAYLLHKLLCFLPLLDALPHHFLPVLVILLNYLAIVQVGFLLIALLLYALVDCGEFEASERDLSV